MSAHELVEKIEEAGHHKGGPGKSIGITMAILGVMLAFCAAMVGSARTELIRATVEKSNLWSLYQSEATKYRVMQADLEMLHAITPSKAELKKFEDKLAAVKRVGGKGDDEDTAELKEAIHVATTELADVLTPDPEDEQRIGGLAAKFKHDMAEAKEDADAYEDLIAAHHEEAESYEHAQLCAEVGIVVASIALLLSSRKVWAVSVIIGLGGGAIVGYTFVHTRAELHHAEERIDEAKKKVATVEKEESEEGAAPAGSAKPNEAHEPHGEHAPPAGSAKHEH